MGPLILRPIRLFQCMTKHVRSNFNDPLCSVQATFYSGDVKYTAVEAQKALDLINNNDDLRKYGVKKAALTSLMKWKSKNGPFKNFEELLGLPGFDEKLIAKVVNALEENVPRTSAGKSKSTVLTTPNVLNSSISSMKSCVALHIGSHSVTWSRIEINEDRPCDLTHWDHYDIISRKKHLHELVKEFLYLDHLIPDAHCYVMENPLVAQSMYPGSTVQVNLNTKQAQMIGILTFAVMKRGQAANENVKVNQLYFLRKFLPSRLFKTLVGTERVSTETAVMDLFRTHYNIVDRCEENDNDVAVALRGNISIPSALRGMYDASEGYQKDFLGQSLLLGLTFIRLCLLKCPKSLSKIKQR